MPFISRARSASSGSGHTPAQSSWQRAMVDALMTFQRFCVHTQQKSEVFIPRDVSTRTHHASRPCGEGGPSVGSLGEQAGKARQRQPFALCRGPASALGSTHLESPMTASAPAFDCSYI